MRILGMALLGSALFVTLAGTAFAADPSVDDLVNALKPNAAQLRGATRGIRAPVVTPDAASSDAHAPAPYVHRVSQMAPAAPADQTSADMQVDFVTGSAALTPRAEQTLNVLGKALTSPALAGDRFRIEGHTDTVGEAAANQDLSQRRAQTVTAYLEQKFGIDSARLDAVGVGSSQLMVPTPANTPEARNRRVKIVNLNG